MIFRYKKIYTDMLIHKSNAHLVMNTDFVIEIWNEDYTYSVWLK